jgi:hypothetical protein
MVTVPNGSRSAVPDGLGVAVGVTAADNVGELEGTTLATGVGPGVTVWGGEQDEMRIAVMKSRTGNFMMIPFIRV